MKKTRGRNCVLVLLVLLSAAPSVLAEQVSGTVIEQGTLTPLEGAIVSLQATEFRTETGLDGSYTLDVPAGSNLVTVAARKGKPAPVATTTGPVSASSSDPVRSADRPPVRRWASAGMVSSMKARSATTATTGRGTAVGPDCLIEGPPVPASSTWGVLVLVLAMLALGAGLLRARGTAQSG